jgi:phosphoribosylformylglycinamidine cyclo-ligase
MIVVVAPEAADAVAAALAAEGETVMCLGTLVAREGEGVVFSGALAL